MKLAIIPPLSCPFLFNEAGDNYKLILPEHSSNQQHFEATMLNHRRGGFTILDNGAAEGKPVEWSELERMARQYRVNEIVLPDVMSDGPATSRVVKEMFDDVWDHRNSYGLMGVVQGQTIDECYDLIQQYLGMQGRTLTSIGLPRCLITDIGVDDARYIMARCIRQNSDDIAIHLLGTCPDYILELRDLGQYYRALGVRGVDTSAPFVYAQAGEYIGDGAVMRRQEDYFDSHKNTFPEKLVEMNCTAMVRWVHG
jgi:hypothetical protein